MAEQVLRFSGLVAEETLRPTPDEQEEQDLKPALWHELAVCQSQDALLPALVVEERADVLMDLLWLLLETHLEKSLLRDLDFEETTALSLLAATLVVDVSLLVARGRGTGS